jgi:hypothetical protein
MIACECILRYSQHIWPLFRPRTFEIKKGREKRRETGEKVKFYPFEARGGQEGNSRDCQFFQKPLAQETIESWPREAQRGKRGVGELEKEGGGSGQKKRERKELKENAGAPAFLQGQVTRPDKR